MTAEIIDGKAIAATIRQEIAVEVAEMQAATGRVPGDWPPCSSAVVKIPDPMCA